MSSSKSSSRTDEHRHEEMSKIDIRELQRAYGTPDARRLVSVMLSCRGATRRPVMPLQALLPAASSSPAGPSDEPRVGAPPRDNPRPEHGHPRAPAPGPP